jgi:hypothetical protein
MGAINTKYSIGDHVFKAWTTTVRKRHKCPDCLGVGKWSCRSPAGDEFSFGCPRCNTRYQSNDALSLDYSEFAPCVEPLTVGSVRLDTNDDRHPVSYMCRETGVGSGTIHCEEDLFPTHAEAMTAAQAKAAAQNSTTEWVVTRYNRTLDLSDYQIESAIMKAARDADARARVDISMLFDDLREADTIERVREVMDSFSFRKAA